MPVNEDNPVPRFAPNRTFIWSRGWNFDLTNIVRTNNYGFVNDQPYDPAANTPLLALVGDSYIEAAMVPFQDTGVARIRRQFSPRGRVYSFGVSGAALSQYLAYAQYIREEFHPDGLVVLIISNDFDESLLKYKSSPGLTYFDESEHGALELRRIDFEPSSARRLVHQSALAMYLTLNVQVAGVPERAQDWWRAINGSAVRYVGNTVAVVDQVRLADSQRAVDAFLASIPSAAGLDRSQILLVIDGNRQEIYGDIDDTAHESSYFSTMRKYVLTQGRAKGFEVLDMHEAFSEHYRQHRFRFEWSHDWYWNGLGHELFAQGVTRSQVYTRISSLPSKRASVQP